MLEQSHDVSGQGVVWKRVSSGEFVLPALREQSLLFGVLGKSDCTREKAQQAVTLLVVIVKSVPKKQDYHTEYIGNVYE